VSPGKDGSGGAIPNRANRVSALESREPDQTFRPSIVHFLVFNQRKYLRRHPDALSCTVPTGFYFGQRYWGTSVSHSIRSECRSSSLLPP